MLEETRKFIKEKNISLEFLKDFVKSEIEERKRIVKEADYEASKEEVSEEAAS